MVFLATSMVFARAANQGERDSIEDTTRWQGTDSAKGQGNTREQAQPLLLIGKPRDAMQ